MISSQRRLLNLSKLCPSLFSIQFPNRYFQTNAKEQQPSDSSSVRALYQRLNEIKFQPPKELKLLNSSTDLTHAGALLGLWNVRHNFDKGFVQIRMVDQEEVLQKNYQHTPYSSYVEVIYNFSSEEGLRERYQTYSGHSIRYGKIIEEIDALTGDTCYKYMRGSSENPADEKEYVLVTVSVDRVDFLSKLDAQKDLKLASYIVNASGSSLITQIDVSQRDDKDEPWYSIGDAIFVFVARSRADRTAYQVPAMRLCALDDILNAKERFEIGAIVKDHSKEKAQRDMKQMMPTYEESKQFHLYLQNAKKVESKNRWRTVPMNITQRGSSLIMHSQDRNRHGKIFGGYLMRESFDLSWLTAHLFSDQSYPELLRVDQVLFLLPVEVGSTLRLQSKVTYSQHFEGLGNVTRVVTKGFNQAGQQAGNFNFLFLAARVQEEKTRLVIPESFDEILDYHEATRRLQVEPIV